jgi:hypothetical protein
MTAAKRRFVACVLGAAAALTAVWLLLAVTASASPPAPGDSPPVDGLLTPLTSQPVQSNAAKIDLYKTVTVAGSCPSSLTATSVVVVVGTPVRYCYTVYNHGTITLTRHSVVDSQIPQLLIDYPYTLTPGSGAQFSRVFTPSASITNTATWTAYNPGPTDVVSDTKTATVTVLYPKAFLPLVLN